MHMMALRTRDFTTVRGVRIGLIALCHRRQLGIGAAMTGETGLRLWRFCRTFYMTLRAGQASSNVLVD